MLSLINTLLGMAINIKTRRPMLANITGGLSGPAVKPVAVRMVWQTAQAVKIPIVGMGGIMTAEDAIEFFLAGATAVAVGTANFVNPRASLDIIDGIRDFLIEQRISRVKELIGKVISDKK
jgi:dihydroorotate dehydrogenase (NAD+) catalytic subunit